jgi:hypothetical protein
MLRSFTVGRAVLVLAIASAFGLAVGAGMALVGAYITGQNQQDGIPLLGQGNLAFAQIPPPKQQALDLMMGCGDRGEVGGQLQCVVINQSNGQFWYLVFTGGKTGWFAQGQGILPFRAADP